jgi:hypothetical protein
MSSRIPSPELITETVEGTVYELPGGTVLVLGSLPTALAEMKPHLTGMLTIRYGFPKQVPATDTIIPGLFAAEKGGFLVGRAAWDYIEKNFQVHPRADVVGISPDGSEVQVFLRELDFGLPVRVFAFERPDQGVHGVQLNALLVGTDAPPVPDLLAAYLPQKPLDDLLIMPS